MRNYTAQLIWERAELEDLELQEDEPPPDMDLMASDFPDNFDIRQYHPATDERSPKCVHVEEEQDQDMPVDSRTLFRETFPHASATRLGTGLPVFEARLRLCEEKEESPCAPFTDMNEFQLADWILSAGVSQSQTDTFLKLPTVEENLKLPFKDNKTFMKTIDSWPSGPQWKCTPVTVTGNVADPNSDSFLTEEYEIFHHDPVEVIQALLSHLPFKDDLEYEPHRLYTDHSCSNCVYQEMCHGDWWWNTLEKVQRHSPGATIAPVILSSDKTHLSQFGGDKKAWPLYLTIGNLSKDVRRKPSSNGFVLIGYIPVPKLACFTAGAKSEAGYRIFHDCVRIILASLYAAGQHGVETVCADGIIRLVHMIVAAYIADFPEQCLVACCRESHCPLCLINVQDRGEAEIGEPRNAQQMLDLLQALGEGHHKAQAAAAGLRQVLEPFWAGLPYFELASLFTPDLLHQLHKGVFKEHLVKWCTEIIGSDEIDAHFSAMPLHTDIRHFKNGISFISQWTGKEINEIEKVFLGIVAGAANSAITRVTKALLDFIHYAHFFEHTTQSLSLLKQALDAFHLEKQIFVDLEYCEHFHRIAKIHMLGHYLSLIQSHGTTDGFNTEISERLHIDLAKNAYRATNRRDFVPQMVSWLQRRQAMHETRMFLLWQTSPKSVLPSHTLLRSEGTLGADGAGNNSEGEETFRNETDGRLDSTASADPVRLHRHLTAIPVASFTTNSSIRIANRAPFHLFGSDLALKYGAIGFLRHVQMFVSNEPALRGGAIIVSPTDQFEVFQRVQIARDPLPALGDQEVVDCVRATPGSKGRRLLAGSPAHFDTALLRAPEEPDGFRVVRVRCLFKLPNHYRRYHHVLAYVEHFATSKHIVPHLGLLQVTPQFQGQVRHVSIIRADSLIGSCHLLPKFGRKIDPTWTSANIFDVCRSFYLNLYSSHPMFQLLRARRIFNAVDEMYGVPALHK